MDIRAIDVCVHHRKTLLKHGNVAASNLHYDLQDKLCTSSWQQDQVSRPQHGLMTTAGGREVVSTLQGSRSMARGAKLKAYPSQ